MPWIKSVDIKRSPEEIYVVSNVGLSYGDYLMLTPLFRGLKQKYDNTDIIFASEIDEELNILSGNPYVSSIIDFDVFLEMYKGGRNIFNAVFDGVYQIPSIIKDDIFKHTNSYKAYCEDAEVTPLSYIPDYFLQPKEKEDASCLLNNNGIQEKEYIFIQTEASSPIRNWHPKNVKELAFRLAETNKVVLVGAYPKWFSEFDFQHENILYLVGKTSVRNACAILSMAKLVVCPDSLFAHISGALGVNCLVLMSSFPAELRYSYMPTVQALQKKFSCAPCMLHNIDCCKNGSNLQADEDGNHYSMPCMLSIGVDEVCKVVEDLLT